MPEGVQCFDIVGNTNKIYLNFFNIAPFWDCVYRENFCAGKCIIGYGDHTSSKCGIIAYFTRFLRWFFMPVVYSSFHDVIEQCKYHLVFTHDVKLYHYLKIRTKKLPFADIHNPIFATLNWDVFFDFVAGGTNWYS